MILRSCNLSDSLLMDEWDPQGEMWVGDKLEWLQARINNQSHHMFVGEYVGEDVAWGQVKIENSCYILAWFVAPEFRRLGLGTRMAQMLAMMCDRPIYARINANRPYSERIAVRLGMLPESGLLDTGEKWWVRR